MIPASPLALPSTITDSPGVDRVRVALVAAGLQPRIVVLAAAAKTARAAADALGCEVAQIANSLVFRGTRTGAPVLVMASGARRVDLDRLSALIGEPAGKADAAFVREVSGFAIGGVAPVGHAAPMRTLVDRTLLAFDQLWAAAGHPHTVFPLTPADLVRITRGEIADLAEA